VLPQARRRASPTKPIARRMAGFPPARRSGPGKTLTPHGRLMQPDQPQNHSLFYRGHKFAARGLSRALGQMPSKRGSDPASARAAGRWSALGQSCSMKLDDIVLEYRGAVLGDPRRT
jgi:hypothetical protein